MTRNPLFALRPEVAALKHRLDEFVEKECIPAEAEYEAHVKEHGFASIPPCVERLKQRAKELRLWNLFLPDHLIRAIPNEEEEEYCPSYVKPSVVLSYREYGILCESLGRCPTLAPEACNCSAPDTGNMEVLLEFGTPQQRQQYLYPLLRGEIRSAFLMTEPAVASSDATNLETKLTILSNSSSTTTNDNNKTNSKRQYVLSGRKWWSTGAMDPRCRLALVVAKMDDSLVRGASTDTTTTSTTTQSNKTKATRHGAHTIIAIPLPHPNVRVKRALTVFGYDDAPIGHAEVELDHVPCSEDDLILGEGSGFRVSQARLGPGRIHHCMRAIGMASRCYELMLQRTLERKTFGKYLWEHGSCQELIADSATDLEAARLLTLSCAAAMDDVGVKHARDKIASIKVAVPELTYRVVDRAVQVHGGGGLSQDYILAKALAALRSLRIADGPDAVHKRTLALLEVKKMRQANKSRL